MNFTAGFYESDILPKTYDDYLVLGWWRWKNTNSPLFPEIDKGTVVKPKYVLIVVTYSRNRYDTGHSLVPKHMLKKVF